MRRRTTFCSYFLPRLLLSLILLSQSSLASAAPFSLPNQAGRATLATSASANPAATEAHASTSGSANAPAAGCAPNACAIYLPALVAGVPPRSAPTVPPTQTPPTQTPPTPTPPAVPASDTEPPSAPSNLRETDKTATSISLAWDAADDNVAVTEYAFYSSSTLVLTTTDLFATVVELTNHTTYTFSVIASDATGNLSPASAQLMITTDAAELPDVLDTHAPTTPADLRATSKTHGTVALAWDSSSDDVAVAEYDLYDNGAWIDRTTATSFTITHLAAVSSHLFRVEAYDTSWNVSDASDALHITTDLPPDPAISAPAVDQTVASDIAGDTAFIYSGDDPIQSGVAPATIQAQRVAILRGRVIDRDGGPRAGVQISVHDHPEYGGTASRADGDFDLAVNGGGPLTVDYSKEGYLPAQRQVVTPWGDYTTLPDVALIALDQAVTTVSLDAISPLQVVAGSVVSDTAGVRQALLIFPADLTATLELPNGEQQPLTTLHVRATEYTVGERGPQAMPGTLPVESAYTYAVDYSVDEALAAGARQVRFSQPVIGYVENFLGFQVGTTVPAGYYDRERAAWVASDNGLIVKIVGVTDGLADLSLNRYGDTNDPALGIGDAERAQLASRYPVGQELWRVPVPHFSSWDYNWPFGPPLDATAPNGRQPTADKPEENPCQRAGSIIECQNQLLGEEAPITGTPYQLHYTSERMADHAASNAVRIPLSGPEVPASLARIELEVDVAGRHFSQSFSNAPNQSYVFVWDKKDAYGRRLQGQHEVTARIGYVYPGLYQRTERFGYSGNGTLISGDQAREEVTIWKGWRDTIGSIEVKPRGLGGWSLDVQHAYDPVGHVLYLGSGGRQGAQLLGPVISSATTGNRLERMSIAPDGQLYYADSDNQTVWRIDTSSIGPNGGSDTPVAGIGSTGHQQGGFSGDGGPALDARLNRPKDVAIGPDGSLYIADSFNHRIRRVGTDGIITTFAGSGVQNFNFADGMLAVDIWLDQPIAVAARDDGSLFILDGARVYRVGTDGRIAKVAGRGTGFWGDGSLATDAFLNNPTDIALGPDGSLYIADTGNNRVRHVDLNGIITTVAGNGASGLVHSDANGDGGPATNALINGPVSVAVAPDGSLYIGEDRRVRWVGPDGIIATVVGHPANDGAYSGDGTPALQTGLYNAQGIALGQDRTLYVASNYASHNGGGPRLLRTQATMPGFAYHDIAIPSSDGNQLYQFDPSGRHLRTLDALTGVALYTFAYDPSGRLASVTDRDGLVTRIERDAAGSPTAIISPYGQRTTLALNGDGYLSAIANPAGEATSFGYTDGGLLTSLTDPRGGVHRFDYDQIGRLTRDTNPVGGFTALSRVDSTNGYTVTLTNALGDISALMVETLPTGEHRRVNIAPNGALSSSIGRPGGVQESTDAQGNLTTIVEGPSPRWGWMAPFVTSIVIRTAAGQAYYTQTASRSATLFDSNDLLSVASQTDTVTTNGHTTTTVYDGSAHTITATDAAGKQTVMALDSLGRLVGEQTTNLAPKQYVYDEYGRLASVSEGNGAATRTTILAYNPIGAPASSTDPLGGTTTFVYDDAGRVTRQILPTGQALFFSYDAAGNRVSATDAQGIRTSFEYDLQNRLIAQTRDPAARAVRSEFAYDAADNLLDQLDDAGAGRLNVATHYSYTPIGSSYAVSSVTDALGQRTELAYTPFGALQSATDPLGHTSVMTYTIQGWLAEVATPGGRTVRTTYDSQGRPISVTDPRGGVSISAYDSLGRLQSITAGAADVDGQPALNQTIGYTYDLNGRTVGMTNPAGQTSTRTYDIFGRPESASDPLGITTTFAYDALDRLVLKTVGANIPAQALQTVYNYDAAGRPLSERVDPDGLNLLTQYRYTRAGSSDTWSLQELVDPKGHATAFHLNSLGQRDQTIDASGQIWRFANDNLGRLVSQTDPLGHVVSYQSDLLGRTLALTEDGRTERRSYRADGRLTNTTDFAGRSTSFSYDDDGRMLGVDYPAGTPDVAYTYDDAGNLTAMADGLGATSYGYDALGRLRERTRDGRTVGYRYDSNSQNAQIDYWGQGTVDYSYDSAGRLASMTPWGTSPTTYAYRGTGLLAEQTRGNGVTTSYGYDSASRLISMLHAAGATNLDSLQYVLDPNGNRTQVTDGDGTTSFGYDELNRMTGASYPMIPGGPNASSVIYSLDALGNRLDDGTTSYSYDASSRIANPSYSYDDNGNLLSDGTTSYSYDAANRLTQSIKGGLTTSYGYDGKGNLIRETVGGVTTDFVLDERGALPLILGEVRSDGTELRYAYGSEGVTAQQTISGTTQTIAYPLLDALGSVRRLTDAAGAVTLARSYDAFGNIRHSAGTGWTPLGFTGERMGAVDGTLYLRARHYSPALGRFLQRDSYAGTIGRPQSLNRYAYTENNPVSRTDPSGHDWEAFTRYSAGIVKGMGALGGAVGSLFKRETWNHVECGVFRLAFQRNVATQLLRQQMLDPIVRGWHFATTDPHGAFKALADDPEAIGEILGQTLAAVAFTARATARAAAAKAAREEVSTALGTTEPEALSSVDDAVAPLDDSMAPPNSGETPTPHKGLLDLSRIEQKARNLQADAQAVLSEAGEEMTDTEEILNAAARRQEIILEKVIKINEMSAEQLQREVLRMWLLDMEDSNKIIRVIRDQVK